MLDIIELEKIIDNEETVTLHLTVKKDMFQGFMMVFEGLMSVNERLSYKLRFAENKVKAEREARERANQERLNRIMAEIRKEYLEQFAVLNDTRQAFKFTRKKFKDYCWLVRKVEKEFKTKRDLEIIRLSNAGSNSYQISKVLKVSPGYIRKTMHTYRKQYA